MNAPTPRTDATVTGNSDPTQSEYEDLAFFARTLERENQVLREEVAEYRVALQKIAVGASLPITDDHPDALIRCEIEALAKEALKS